MISLCQHSMILTARPKDLTMQGIICTTRRILTRSNSFMREWDQGGEPLFIPLAASLLASAFPTKSFVKGAETLTPLQLPIPSFRCCFQSIHYSFLKRDPCEKISKFDISNTWVFLPSSARHTNTLHLVRAISLDPENEVRIFAKISVSVITQPTEVTIVRYINLTQDCLSFSTDCCRKTKV